MRESIPRIPLLIVAVVIVAVIAVVVGVRSCSSGKGNQSLVGEVANAAEIALVTSQLQHAQAQATYELDPRDFLAIPGSREIAPVSLDGGKVPSLSDDALVDVRDAIEAIEATGDDYPCGFVFVDLGTGRGVAYNAAEDMYIASAAKAPLSLYAMLNGAGDDEEARQSIEDALLYSDNEAFEEFGYRYVDEGYGEWLVAHEVYHEDYGYDLYPPMSARSLACFWAEILQYVQSGTEEARWYSELLSQTETSFIRDGLYGYDVNVLDKGGWIADEDLVSVTDAAIIETGGRLYLMVILSGQPDGGQTEQNVSDLARALFQLRADLK